jgi:MFS transporter, DHA1 family, multidrug resistance protein
MNNTKSQLPYLVTSSLSILFVGMGILPILPLYAAELGASPGVTGLFLGFIYIAFTAGTLLPGPLASRFGLRNIFILAGILSLPAVFLLGQINEFWQLIVLASILWFAGGIGNSLISVYTGLYAGKDERGRWFSMIALTAPLGVLSGGLIVGRLVDGQGYSFMFTILALVWAIWPVTAYLKIDDHHIKVKKSEEQGASRQLSLREKMPLLLLLLAILFSMLTINAGRLGFPLVMKLLEYTPGSVSTAMAFGGLVTLPFAYSLGRLSDRFGRKNILILGYMFAAGGVLLLIAANHTWHFWTAAALLLIAMTVNGSVASAFATDLLSPEVLVRVLPIFMAVGSAAGILGFAAGGYLIETLGFTVLFFGAAVFSIAAASLLIPLHCERQLASIFEPGWSCDLSFRPGGPAVSLAEVEPKLDPALRGIQTSKE